MDLWVAVPEVAHSRWGSKWLRFFTFSAWRSKLFDHHALTWNRMEDPELILQRAITHIKDSGAKVCMCKYISRPARQPPGCFPRCNLLLNQRIRIIPMLVDICIFRCTEWAGKRDMRAPRSCIKGMNSVWYFLCILNINQPISTLLYPILLETLGNRHFSASMLISVIRTVLEVEKDNNRTVTEKNIIISFFFCFVDFSSFFLSSLLFLFRITSFFVYFLYFVLSFLLFSSLSYLLSSFIVSFSLFFLPSFLYLLLSFFPTLIFPSFILFIFFSLPSTMYKSLSERVLHAGRVNV